MTASKYAGWRHGLVALLLIAVATGGNAADQDQDGGDDEEAGRNPPPPMQPTTVTPFPQPIPGGPNVVPSAGAATPGTSAQTPKVNGNEVLLNFQAADIQAVVKAISQMTNRNFLLDPRVKGQVTIISAKPVPRSAAYQIFLSALKAQGFTAVDGPSGLVRIIPINEAKQGADVTKDGPRGGEQVVTHVAILQNVSANMVVPILRPLMAPTSQLGAYEQANALVITDYADNIRRLLAILERIDQPAASEVTVVPLKNASALDIAELITRLAVPPGAAGAPPGVPTAPGLIPQSDRFTIIPDLRTNSLLIRTESPGRLAQLQSLIGKLDVQATTGGQTRVIYLRNAEATKLADVLRGLLAGEARAQQASAPAAAAGGAPGVRPAGGAQRSGAEASQIQADEATNALIINASDAVYNNLRAVIEKLDVRRAQVFVEALVAEISMDKAIELGFQWAAAGDTSNGGAIAGVSNYPTRSQGGIIAARANPATALGNAAGLTLAFLGKAVTLPDGTRVSGIGALARALESQSQANVLSTPNLLTLDNAEAKIIVGQNVPFITGGFLPQGTTASTAGGVNPFQTIERKDIGIQLKIKPQISEGGTIKLDIFQEISTVASSTVTASDIITNKRSVETKVLVDDGATVVLGGLIEDRINDNRAQIPLLGRIPLLGALFRSKDRTHNKTNLMVFLKPTIIRTVEDSYRVATDRYGYIRALGTENETDRLQQLDRIKPTPPPPPKAEKEKEKEKEKPAMPHPDPLNPSTQ